MQITSSIMPEFKSAGDVFLYAEMQSLGVKSPEVPQEKKETKEDIIKDVLTRVQRFIEHYTLKISNVIVKICRKKDLKYDVAIKDSSLVPKMFQRFIGIKPAGATGEESYKNVAKFTVDCRRPKIDIKIDIDPCCPKIFRTRVKAQIKNLKRR